MNVGESIKRHRVLKGMSQFSLSKGVGIAQSYLSGIESGKKTPSLKVLKSISERMGIPLPILMWNSIDDSDIPSNKKEAFDKLKPSVDAIVNSFF